MNKIALKNTLFKNRDTNLLYNIKKLNTNYKEKKNQPQQTTVNI